MASAMMALSDDDNVRRGLREVTALTSCEEEDAALEASVEWLHSGDLGYPRISIIQPHEKAKTCSSKRCCSGGPPGTSSGLCARCSGSWYCSRECQVQDWKAGHKHACARVARFLDPSATLNHRSSVVRLLRRIRLYTAPFVVANEATTGRGKGFVFLQTPNLAAEFSLLECKVDPTTGEKYNRSVVLDFLTAADFAESGENLCSHFCLSCRVKTF